MKLTNILPIACAAFTLAAAHTQAGDGPDAQQHNLTIDLTIKYEGDYSQDYKKDEASYKDSVELITEKISNKQILEFLVEDDVIATIKGWSISLISYNGDAVATYLVKKGENPINITEYFSAEMDDLEVNTYKGFYSDKTGDYSSNGTLNSIASVSLSLDFDYQAQGA